MCIRDSSDVCDVSTAKIIKREVSDGVIAPGYEPEALEILKAKKKGNYNIIQIDAVYVPAPVEHKEVFGITFEQGRNELKVDDELLANVVTENKEIPELAKIDLIISLITLKYTCLLYTSGSLSGGEMKRIEIATAFSKPHKLCIFDEPEAGIDLWSFSMLVQQFEEIQMCIRDRG